MDPVTLVLVPGMLGGLAIGILLSNRLRARRQSPLAPPYEPDAPITNMYNISAVRVAGVGGLGLLAMATTVALNVPMIGAAMALGAVLGGAFAVGLILYKRRTGPMPSSGKGIGASTVLPLREPPPVEVNRAPDDLRMWGGSGTTASSW
jgi:hypothetical protein